MPISSKATCSSPSATTLPLDGMCFFFVFAYPMLSQNEAQGRMLLNDSSGTNFDIYTTQNLLKAQRAIQGTKGH
jgi:hypothetical protein